MAHTQIHSLTDDSIYNPLLAEVLLGLLLFFSSLDSTSASEIIYLFTVIPTLILLLLYTLVRRPLPEFVVPRFAFTLVLIIWGAYFVSLVTPPVESHELVRIFPFFIANICVMFWLPNIIEVQSFIRQLALFGCVLTVIGLPTAVFGSYSVGPLLVSGVDKSIIFFPGVELSIVSSIFRNQNLFSLIAAMGAVSSFGAYFSSEKRLYMSISLICFIGLFLARGRASILASLIGVGIILLHQVAGAKRFRQVVVLGTATSFVGLLYFFWKLPVGQLLSNINLSGREYLWPAGVKVIAENPLFGTGLGSTSDTIAPYLPEIYAGRGVHNSYLYMFITAGIVGGASYLLLVIQTGLLALRRVNSPEKITIFALFIGLLTIQMFSSSIFFGFSVRPIITGLTFGYLFQILSSPDQL